MLKTDVLVHLCNVRGGQIPDKIYHYSATTKPILFILDGTPEEIKLIKKYFSKFNRYIFCDNQKDDILNAINRLKHKKENFENKPLTEFSPKQVVFEMIETIRTEKNNESKTVVTNKYMNRNL